MNVAYAHTAARPYTVPVADSQQRHNEDGVWIQQNRLGARRPRTYCCSDYKARTLCVSLTGGATYDRRTEQRNDEQSKVKSKYLVNRVPQVADPP